MSPEVNFPKPAVWKEFELRTQYISPPIIKLKIMPLTGEAQLRRAIQMKKIYPEITDKTDLLDEKKIDTFIERLPDAVKGNIPIVMKQVIGWDLTEKGAPLTCSDNNKKKYLVPLLWENVKAKKKKEKEVYLVRAIIDFASDLRNFTKN